MNDKELIQALRGAMVETGSLLCLGCGHEHNCSTHGCAIIRAAAERLAAYEDTGLKPEDIDALQKREQGLAEMLVSVSCGCAVPYTRLAELAQAEKDGRLVVLPCKVGDVVWVNDDCVRDWSAMPLPYKCWVFGIEITEKEKRFHVESYKTGRVFPFDFAKFGKTVFLTREEAEAALKKREDRRLGGGSLGRKGDPGYGTGAAGRRAGAQRGGARVGAAGAG